MRLAAYLIAVLSVAGTYSWLHLSGLISFGLGWAIRPGMIVLAVVLALGLLSIKKMPAAQLIFVFACLICAIFSEYLDLARPVGSFLILGLSLFSASILVCSLKSVRIVEFCVLALCAYVQSTAMYNLFQGQQMMFFFKPGWTL
jgi:uncharacterized membrane protein YgdD (TMEM256/DUF423 family)